MGVREELEKTLDSLSEEELTAVLGLAKVLSQGDASLEDLMETQGGQESPGDGELYLVDRDGQVKAVLLPVEEYEAMLDRMSDLEDMLEDAEG